MKNGDVAAKGCRIIILRRAAAVHCNVRLVHEFRCRNTAANGFGVTD